MASMSRRAWLGVCSLATLAGGLVGFPTKRSWASTSARETIRERYFPNLVLTTHEGKQVRFYDDLIKDKIVTLNVFYTSCEVVCPVAMANLVRVHDMLGDRVGRDIFMYSITLDPEHDTPEALKAYATSHGVGPGWLLLTGKREDIELLRRTLGFTWADPVRDANRDNHTGNLRYGNEPLMRWGAVPAMANASWIKTCILYADWPNKGAT